MNDRPCLDRRGNLHVDGLGGKQNNIATNTLEVACRVPATPTDLQLCESMHATGCTHRGLRISRWRTAWCFWSET